jgi:catechol 2,3-dioxygenase-like lactoylglutathione lyase family enzyme
MIKTHGLSHIALSVVDPDGSLAFYRSVFGVREYYRNESTIQVLEPGPHDVLAFEKRPTDAGAPGGIIHFGFRLTRPEDIDAAVAAVEIAGGAVTGRGEFGPGLP